jgi:hypothetical protein
VWLRTGEVEQYTVTRKRTAEWVKEFEGRVLEWDGVFHPGDHCGICPRQATCQGLQQWRSSALTVVSGVLDISTMADDQILELHRRRIALEAMIDALKSAIRAEVDAREEVKAGGWVLHLVGENGPRKVDPLAAWPVLQSHLTDREIAACVRVSVGDVEKKVAEKAGRGKGAAAKRALCDDLEKAGAVMQVKIEKLKLERVQ